jgi:hypothetical protein
MSIRVLAALALFLTFATLCPAQLSLQSVPPKFTEWSSGKAMFHEYCATCHGESGAGNGPVAASLKKAPADLTRLSAHNSGKFPDVRVSRFIKGDDVVASHGAREMPVWGDIFRSMSTDYTILAMRVYNLTNYVKSLQIP